MGISKAQLWLLSKRGLRRTSPGHPALSIHWITFVLYVPLSISIMLTVSWKDTNLPDIYSLTSSSKKIDGDPCGRSSIAVVLALCNIGQNSPRHTRLSDFVNGCLLYSVLSAANTAPYLASRTLYGLASSPRLRERGYLGGYLQSLGTTHPRTGVPVYALVASWLILCWVPLPEFNRDPDWDFLGSVSNEWVIKLISML